MTHPDTSVY